MKNKKLLTDWTNEELIQDIIALTDKTTPYELERLNHIKSRAEELKKRLQPRIKIMARDWYDGYNYYHSVRVFIDNGKGYELIGHNPFSWGSLSNSKYKETAYNLLVEAGVFPKIEGHTSGGAKKGFHWFLTHELMDNRNRYDFDLQTVRRKKDM